MLSFQVRVHVCVGCCLWLTGTGLPPSAAAFAIPFYVKIFSYFYNKNLQKFGGAVVGEMRVPSLACLTLSQHLTVL